MLRLLHTADVHLGARHAHLGEQAAAQRERQFAAFKATIDLALAEKVDVVLIAGDLFDSNSQPKRSVERVAAELKRLSENKIRTVIIPGTHDVYDRSSVYRAHDLAAMVATDGGTDLVTVLTPDRPDVHLAACDAVIHARVFDTKRAPQSPLRDLHVGTDKRATWKIGLVHAAVSIPGKTDGDDVVVTKEEIAASGLDYLALGHWHSTQRGTAGAVTYAYSGAPEPVAVDQDKAGKVLLVTLDNALGQKAVAIEERQVGQTRFEKLEVDAAGVTNQPALVERLTAKADKDLVLDVRIVGIKPDDLDIDVDEIESQIRGSFLKARVRDLSLPAMTEGVLPPPDTIAGAFIREVEGRIAELEAADGEAQSAEAAELRDVLRLGRLLLAGNEVAL
ncbi:MAG: DNA repair exonuclease [Chloroflexota bacterium]|nr:DNA repair exonuclease [Chloroflexota bacterium]